MYFFFLTEITFFSTYNSEICFTTRSFQIRLKNLSVISSDSGRDALLFPLVAVELQE